MSESGRPKNDSTFPSQTTTLLIGAMAPENSQLALNFEAIFPGATKVFPVFAKKSKGNPHNDSLIGDSSDEEIAEIQAAEVVAEEIKEAKAALAASLEIEHNKQALPGSEAAPPQAGK